MSEYRSSTDTLLSDNKTIYFSAPTDGRNQRTRVVRDINIGATFDQLLSLLDVASYSGQVQRCFPSLVSLVQLSVTARSVGRRGGTGR